MDDNVIDLPGDAYRAVTLRAFDPKTGLWAIWWLDGRDPGANLDPPVKGGFDGGVGTFFADITFSGKPVRMRFVCGPGVGARPSAARSASRCRDPRLAC